MKRHNRYEGIHSFVVTVITNEVKKLIGRFGLCLEDIGDLEQELHLQVWRKLNANPEAKTAPYHAVVRRIVDTKIKDLIEMRSARRRKGDWEAARLDEEIESGDETCPLGDLLDLEESRERHEGKAAPWHKRRHRKLDFEEAMSHMPESLRALCATIEEFDGNLGAVARELQLTRKKIRIELTKLRRVLKDLKAG